MFLRHPANDSSNSIDLSLLMSELYSILCFKLYSLNFESAHAQKKIVMLIRIGHSCVALNHKKSLETSSKINLKFIKILKKLSPYDKNMVRKHIKLKELTHAATLNQLFCP